jgi:hypothetical protein
MGKKGEIGRKRKLQAAELDAEDGSDEPIDPELQAELNAVLSMRAERGEAVVGSTEASAAPGSGGGYKLGKEALAKATESLGTHSLPFIESMQICKFDLSLDDENDDLAREVCMLYLILLLSLTCIHYLFAHLSSILSLCAARLLQPLPRRGGIREEGCRGRRCALQPARRLLLRTG